MSHGPVHSEYREHVLWITIDRPDRRNAFNNEVLRCIIDGLQQARSTESTRAIVLTGAGDRAFCAGGDLGSSSDVPFDIDPAHPRNPLIELFNEFEACEIPTIARVNGDALGGGLGLVCACDLAVASDTATLGVPETRVGLFPMMILPYLQRTIPRRQLMEWCLTGARLAADEALAAGLLNYVASPDQLDDEVQRLLNRILDRSPTAIRLGKMGFHALQDMSLPQAFEYSQLMLQTMSRTQDAEEGFRAFREKRPPKWPGQ